ncbi:DUF7691 family protein [Enemella sp. A6]|uniref:DUF7691 family protein n=1 Tax=Enemella sp. A6 TaxID=3440152 RepID=UPI003EC04610
MGELRLYAIGIDEIRAMFGADEHRGAQLREIAAADLTPPAPPKQRGLLGVLGPIFKRPPGTVPVDPDQPRAADLEDQIAGRHPDPDRLVARWRLLEVLVTGTAWSSTKLPLPGTLLNDIDFSMACVGVPTSLSLASLLDDDLRTGLPPLPGLRVGFCHHPRALARAEAYRDAVELISEPERAEAVEKIAAWLSGFVRWGELAPELGRPEPSLVGFYS